MEGQRPARVALLGKNLNSVEIAGLFDTSNSTVSKWMKRHEIESQSASESRQITLGTTGHLPLHTKTRGHEVWRHRDGEFPVHRLLGISIWGADPVVGNHVHHKNGIPWDNRPENLEILSNSEHQAAHRKVNWLNQLRIAELYENGDISIRDLAEEFDLDISSGTVIRIHKKFYGNHDS